MLTSRFASDGLLCPSVTVTRLAVAVCAAKLMLEARGRPVPVGYAVSRLKLLSLTAVTLTTTAVAVGGIVSLGRPLTPVICTVRVTPGPSAPGPHWTHPRARVSRMRNGTTGTYPARFA